MRGRHIPPATTAVQFSLPDAEIRRLDTWALEIAQRLLPGTPCHVNGSDEIRFGNKGSLALYADSSWFDFEVWSGGPDTISLIGHLTENPTEVRRFTVAWLNDHPGAGTRIISDGDDGNWAEQCAAWAREVLAKTTPLSGTPSAAFLTDERGLPPVFPKLLGHLPLGYARDGECALVATFTNEAGEVGGVQLGYLTPHGKKSSAIPARKQFWVEVNKEKRRNYLFRIAPVPVENNPLAGVTLIAEGVEKILAVHAAFPGCTALGLGSIGRLRFVPPIRGDVLIVRDGDDPGSPAERSLIHGIDHLLLTGAASVRVTATPLGMDADDILKQRGIDVLRALILEARPKKLSPHGEARRLADIRDPIDFAQARTEIAREQKIPKSALDAEVKKIRAAQDAAAEELIDQPGPKPWPEPIVDIGLVLSEASDEIAKHVIATKAQRDTAVLWALHTHFVHHELVHLPISPQLGIRSIAPECGKTTFLDTTSFLVHRPIRAASITAAAVYRIIDKMHPTLTLDECDRLLKKDSNPELVAILRASHRKRDATVYRMVPTPDGDWTIRAFSAWGTYVYTATARVEEALLSRAIVIVLQRAQPHELKGLRPLEDGMSQVLTDCGRKFCRWAQDQVELPTGIAVPDTIVFRDRDNWRPLLRIAKAAGDDWLRRACIVATVINGVTTAVGDVVPLLADIREVFGTKAQLTTEELVAGLLALSEPSFDWTRACRGLPINAYYLRDRLKDVINPPENERRWYAGSRQVRGYQRKHFEDAFARYLPLQRDAEAAT